MSTGQQRQSLSLEQRHMTTTESDLYRNKTCQFCRKLVKRFPSKDFFQIDNIFPDEEDATEDERCIEDTPNDCVFIDNIIDVENNG